MDQKCSEIKSHKPVFVLAFVFFVVCFLYSHVGPTMDEMRFILDPYLMLGGDYTKTYLQEGRYFEAISVAYKSYSLYWRYRPRTHWHHRRLKPEDALVFSKEMKEFYGSDNPSKITIKEKKLIVPIPNQYNNYAGKPLLSAWVTLPSLFLVERIVGSKFNHYIQTYNYHSIFAIMRLSHIFFGVASILLLYFCFLKQYGERKALLGSAIFAFFPCSVMYFSSVYHDGIMVPFVILSTYFFVNEKYIPAGICCGLSLAVKSSAIFLAAMFFFFIIGKIIWGEDRSLQARFLHIKNLVTAIFFSLLVLSAFASPVSYISEMLTPFTEPDLESVGFNSLASEAKSTELHRANRRSELVILERLGVLRHEILFVILLCVLFAQFQTSLLAKFSFAMILFTIPYSMLFQSGLGYRYMMFVPFLSIVLVELASEKSLKIIFYALVGLTTLLMVDPVTASGLNFRYQDNNFIGLIFSLLY